MLSIYLTALTAFFPLAAGHAAIFHPSMWGFNVTQQTFSYDNRPVAPLMNMTFDQWWFHGHLDYPPNSTDFFELPAGQPATAEIACTKSATSFFNSSGGGNIQNGNDPCPGSPPSEYHTTGESDVKGCALAIAYKSNVTEVQPGDFSVFSVNQTCVWNRFTDFQVPSRMPPCPPGGCICAFFWIHSPDSGSEQNYMNGFQCNVTGSTSNVALAQSQVPRRCGADPANGKPNASPGNCTYGAKQPFYWFQAEQNNMFEDQYAPPFYNDLYNFIDGPQDDIFADSYPSGIPPPSPNSTVVPSVFLGSSIPVTASTPTSSSSPASSASAASPTSASVSLTALSAVNSASVSASLALPSASIPFSSASAPSSDFGATSSVAVSTATVISTLIITVTAAPSASSAPDSAFGVSASATSVPLASGSSAIISSAFSFPSSVAVSTGFITPSVVAASSSSGASPSAASASFGGSSSAAFTSVSVSSSAAVSSPSIIILNPTGVSSSVASNTALSVASSAASSVFSSVASSASSAQTTAIPSSASSDDSFQAASTIFLNAPAASASASTQNESSLEVHAQNDRVLEAAAPSSAYSSSATATVCKRDSGHKLFRRRRSPLTAADPKTAEPEAEFVVSRFHSRRKMHDRRQLWDLF
ncbi:hypothetical protein OBBRIDRAFT_788832 [Obba rivulosa]|uniref:Uncharacterized protein n=1 Tax=Obba rivulosa TaxID=1052685 RepID=A0A8E2DS66_9APHY|nr:hypothetical protein OBBRIDRAFT_788832 [Obba rivulosa]